MLGLGRNKVKSDYKVVTIANGVVGSSMLYDLAKFSWTDVIMLERLVLSAASPWHATGQTV